jgi:hypothetical protein
LIVVVEEPTVMVLLRGPPGLAATLYLIVPLPGPLPPDAIVIQGAPLVAVQLQDARVDTVMDALVLPLLGTSTFAGLNPNAQGASA